MIGQFLGFLLATYFLVGRWSTDRLDGAGDATSFTSQPRMWILVALVPVVLLLRYSHGRRGQRVGPTSVDYAIWAFLAYMMFAALWASNGQLAFDKACELAVMLGIAVAIGASHTARADHQIRDGFWFAMVLFGTSMASLAVLYSVGGRIHVPGGGPITFGRNMGLMALGAVHLAGKYGTKAKPFCAAAVVVAVLMILMCGSRGALLSSSVGAAVLLATAREALSKKLALAAAVVLLGAVVILSTHAGQEALDTFQDRVVTQTFEKRHLSDRDDLWLDAVDWIQERPWFGWGLNGYRANSWNYPHNIFLETTVEGGVVALVLLLNVARAWWSRARRQGVQIPRVELAALGLAFTAAQTSGDLFDSRGVFLLVALATPTTVQVLKLVRRRRVAPRPADFGLARPIRPKLADASVPARPRLRLAADN